MNKYLTEIEVGKDTYAGPDIYASSMKEAKDICREYYKDYVRVVGRRIGDKFVSEEEMKNLIKQDY